MIGNEIIFDNLLMEIFVYDVVGIGKIDLVFNYVKLFWCYCWYDVIDYGVRKGDMFCYSGC